MRKCWAFCIITRMWRYNLFCNCPFYESSECLDNTTYIILRKIINIVTSCSHPHLISQLKSRPWRLLNLPEIVHSPSLLPSIWCVQAGITAAPARAVSAVKNMNIPQQIKDMKLPDLPQAIKDLKFWPAVTSLAPSWLVSSVIPNVTDTTTTPRTLFPSLQASENAPMLPATSAYIPSQRYQS